MALILNLRLTRRGDEAWGFRLIGGVDFKMPLTVVKVEPYSPAEAAGLRHGDTLLSISGRCAGALTHDCAHDVIKACQAELSLEIARGRYDPVLDDQEPLFEQIDQMEDESVDFVPLSDPSEVFTTMPDLSREPSMNPDAFSRGTSELADPSRSLTASPFVLPTKPYRPFSTEPIPEVPPLEEPIVLNPNYHDEFGQTDDEDFLPKSKFKLPISEQYDPGNDAKGKVLKGGSAMRIDLSKKEIDNMKEDLMFMKQMKQDIDLERMETTASTVAELTNVAVAASSVVEDSLFKAVTVAEEIKKEIDVELSSYESNEIESSKKQEFIAKKVTSANSEHVSSSIETSKLKQCIKVSKEIASEAITKDKSEKSNTEVVQISKSVISANLSTEEEKKVSSTRQEAEESIIAGTVKRLSSNYEKEVEQFTSSEVQQIGAKDTQREVKDLQECKSVVATGIDTNSNSSNQYIKTTEESATVKKKTEKSAISENRTKFSTERLLSEQRAYTIGLQTIPNIKGKVNSSYHYDLLLKTFFIHLTDVMVALSRFILAENDLSLEGVQKSAAQRTEDRTLFENENIVQQEVVTSTGYKVQEEIVAEQQEKCTEKRDGTGEDNVKQDLKKNDEEIIENRKLTGSQMAQRTSKKSEELTEKMDAVITEFQNKTGVEESNVKENESLSIHERRSRSKSRIEEEVSKESDPLEWLSKKEEAREVIAETVQTCKALEEFTQSKIDITESVREMSTIENELKTEKREDRRSKSKDRNTYIAIVESHVYTNKDTILEEHLSGRSSIQNSAEIKESMGNVYLEDSQFSKSTEETKQVTKEEVAVETATVNVEETKKFFLEEAKKISLADDSQQLPTKNEQEKETSKVLVVAEVTQRSIESESKLEEILLPSPKPAEISKPDVQATVEIQTEIPVLPTEKLTQISTFEKTMSESRHDSNLQTEISKTQFKSEAHQVTERTDINQQTHQLSLDLKQDGYKLSHVDSPPSTIDTPTPATVPPTPLTDEYIFRLEIPLPKTSGLTPEDDPEPSPDKESDHEDLTIVQRKWDIDSPTIETVVYDPPLATPVEVTNPPKFSNAVLSEASGEIPKEEILEIGRKSSLLASAIDETIKCIEEYKEQVGMETRRSLSSEDTKKTEPQMNETILETKPMYNGIVAEAKTTIYTDMAAKTSDDAEKHKENWSKVTEQFRKNGKASEIPSKTSESSLKGNCAVTSADVVSTGVAQNFVSQNVIDTNTSEDTSSCATVAITATRENQDFLTSSLVSQNTDAVNKLTEYSVDSSEKNNYTSKTTSEENQRTTSSYEALSVDASFLETSIKTETTQKSQISIDELEKITQSLITQTTEVKTDPLEKIRSVPFNPDELKQTAVSLDEAVSASRSVIPNVASYNQGRQLATPRNVIMDGEVLATHQGIISGVDDPVISEETAKELGRPGLTDEKIAEIMSGESEMLREAHVMGLSRVIASHMTRVDENDSSVDFKKIKPTIDKLKDSEVLKALNDELTKTKAEVKKDERKWTTFLQKPDRPQPQAKFGYHGWLPQFIPPKEQYKVKIVKQPKPKVAPDYKPEDFETGLLPWELRAATEPPPPPVSAEDPILIPEEEPEFYEAVDPLQESEVPDLEETGIPLPPEKVEEPEPQSERQEVSAEEIQQETEENNREETQEEVIEEELTEEMEQNRLAEQLLNNVQSMVDPNATLEQQLAQMRAQLSALAQLPGVIQQSLELVTRQLMLITQQESTKVVTQSETVEETVEQTEVIHTTETVQESVTDGQDSMQVQELVEEDAQHTRAPEATPEEMERMRLEEQEILDEQRRVEKQKKELLEQIQLEQESRLLKQRPTPRVGRPKPAFGPLVPAERPLVLPGGRKWRKPKDAYNDQFIAETLQAQAEIIQGKTKGLSYESVLLPYDERINFMKYEKPPVSLEHLRDSDVYKMVHGMEQAPGRRVDMLTPVVAECDYREKCRSMTPCGQAQEHLDMPQQVAP